MPTKVKLAQNQKFNSRAAIRDLLGGNLVDGITASTKTNAMLLFANEAELYTDYFYPKGTYENCLYTGIGRRGHQDSLNNKRYTLNIDILSHKKDKRALLVFEKRESKYFFIGKYQLMETHQNVQPDDDNNLRRVFVFHIKRVADVFNARILR